MNIRNILGIGLIVACSGSAFGWGQKGHDTVAEIARRHLTPTARAAVDSLLDGRTIVYYANWLDNASHTPEYAYSKTWHYKNIDAGKTFEDAPLLKEGDIVRALDEQIALLADPTATKEQKALALKMVTHLLGDIHQPLHMGHKSDLGGNRWNVLFFKSGSNLHSVWDSKLPESAHKWSYTEWADQLDGLSPQAANEIIAGGTPASWGKETYEICTEVYNATPEGTNIAYDYIADWTPTVENQFLKGGLRLADVLNMVFDPTYVTVNGIGRKQ